MNRRLCFGDINAIAVRERKKNTYTRKEKIKESKSVLLRC